MDANELLKKVRKIEIKSKGISSHLFAGEYHSAFKGRGMAFSEVREYYPGDDIRTIDWNVTARFGHPYVKVFEEEREMTVMLLIDVSASEEFGTGQAFKKELITEVAAVLAFSAIQNNDKIGVILFTDQIEKFIPPKKGKTHILRIIRELVEFQPQHKQTDIGSALKYFNNVIKKRSTAFILSDFQQQASQYENALKIAGKKHDMIALRFKDPMEEDFPSLGLVWMQDPETNQKALVDTSNKKVRNAFYDALENFERRYDSAMRRSGIDQTVIKTDRSYIKPLMNLFKKREKK